MGLRTDDLDFDLDPALVADHPVEPRDAARMLVVTLPPASDDDGEGLKIAHHAVEDLPMLLGRGDRLVLNATRVAPARVRCRRLDTGGELEGLLVESVGPGCWWAMLRRSRRLRPGHELVVLDRRGDATSLRLEVRDLDEEGRVLVSLADAERREGDPGSLVARLHEEAGLVPLPPYILKARRDRGRPEIDPHDRDWYQTVYARERSDMASVAAPTAGLHLTPEVLERVRDRGGEAVEVSLEVGAGTFKPVEVEELSHHVMHTERCVIDPPALAALRQAAADRRAGFGRIVAVGTTSVRTLESMPTNAFEEGMEEALAWSTDLLVQPGHRWRFVDAMLTNFHLPRSTLLALVAGFTGLGRMRRIYAEAIRERYRFFSYGDAMFVHRAPEALD